MQHNVAQTDPTDNQTTLQFCLILSKYKQYISKQPSALNSLRFCHL